MLFVRPAQDSNTISLPATIAGKASRFFARNVRSKTLALRHTAPMVTFTFDDVPASACELGAPILEEYDARGTFYVAGRGCGTSDLVGPTLATIEQLRKIWAAGHEIGCHTYSHPAVSTISTGLLGTDLERNRWALKTIDARIELRNFAYPYGDLSFRTKRYLEGRFDSCRSVHCGINRGIADLGSLKAWPLEDATADRVKIRALVASLVRSGGWLIFYSHEVAEQPNRYGVSPDLLRFAVATARSSGCILSTIAGGLKVIRESSRPLRHLPPLAISKNKHAPVAPPGPTLRTEAGSWREPPPLA